MPQEEYVYVFCSEEGIKHNMSKEGREDQGCLKGKIVVQRGIKQEV